MLAQTSATSQCGHQSDAYRGAKEGTRASSADERQGSKHMRGKVSLSALDRISHRDAPSRHLKAAFLDERQLTLRKSKFVLGAA
jgi:hypothetical protein